MKYQKKLLSMGFVKNDDGDFEIFWSEHYK